MTTLKNPKELNGVLLVHKPAGITSNDVLFRLKKVLQRKDIGHGGTLDSFATGLLPVFLGEGLKLSRFFLESYPTLPTYWKTYEAVLSLGTSTESGDPLTAVLEEKEVPDFSDSDLQKCADFFLSNSYMQTPPQYSAKKIDGVRASDLARKGIIADLKAVAVTLKSLEIEKLSETFLKIKTTCSKGTYIRRLGEDVAKKLNTCGHLKSLHRTAVGNFSIENAAPLAEFLENVDLAINKSFIDLVQMADRILPSVFINEETAKQVTTGYRKILESFSTLSPGVFCLKLENKNIPVAIIEVQNGTVNMLRGFVLS